MLTRLQALKLVALATAALAPFAPVALLTSGSTGTQAPAKSAPLPKAFITGEGWQTLPSPTSSIVNGDADTWTEQDGVIHGTGKPTRRRAFEAALRNFEMVLEWKHHERGGNSGAVRVVPRIGLRGPASGARCRAAASRCRCSTSATRRAGCESKGKHSDWFTSHGDVFPVGQAAMQAFTPQIDLCGRWRRSSRSASPKSSRSFPTQAPHAPVGEWNHYYVRAINGEIRLWVNGEEVNGGRDCKPAEGYLALEAEGAPVEFRNLRIRELP
jgi:hypothetical protein